MRFMMFKTDREGEVRHAAPKGDQVEFSGTKRTVMDGPFTESKEMIAGLRPHTAAKP
jgi:hypothetical protein